MVKSKIETRINYTRKENTLICLDVDFAGAQANTWTF